MTNRRKHKPIKDINLLIEELSKRSDGVTIDVASYRGMSRNARFIDPEYGEFWSTPSNLVRGRHHPERGYEIRRKKLSLPIEQILLRLVDRKDLYLDVSSYVDTDQKARFIDVDFGEFWAEPSEIFTGRTHPTRSEMRRKQTKEAKLGKHLTPDERKFRQYLGSRIRNALLKIDCVKSSNTSNLLGCGLQTARDYVEQQFRAGMSWQTWSKNGWHMDHKVPLSLARNKEEMEALCHYTNLQPLSGLDNIAKGNVVFLQDIKGMHSSIRAILNDLIDKQACMVVDDTAYGLYERNGSTDAHGKKRIQARQFRNRRKEIKLYD